MNYSLFNEVQKVVVLPVVAHGIESFLKNLFLIFICCLLQNPSVFLGKGPGGVLINLNSISIIPVF